MSKKFLLTLLVLLVATLNYWLLLNFNTLRWPYLWPRPGIFILLSLFVIALWFKPFFKGIWVVRLMGLLMVFVGQSYIVHSWQVTWQDPSLIALIHTIGVSGVFGVMVLNFINQSFPKVNKIPPVMPKELPTVAVVIPTYGEPYPILEQTVLSVKKLTYPADKLFILVSDDGRRPEVQRMAEVHGVRYNQGPKKDAKAGNLNAALEYLAQHCPQATLILTQDADEVIDETFLQKTTGYFQDPKIAFVQTPKEAIVPEGDPFGNRDRVFYDTLQAGRNGSNAAFACGSGVIWRIEAVKSIGGFATWNLVEDLTTSYFLHSKGWRSEYHDEILSIGLSPDDIPGLLKQRGTWAADTWRLFLFDNPVFKQGLDLRQRLQYLELTLFYFTSTIFTPLLMLTPMLSLATGTFVPIEGSALLPWFIFSMGYYVVLAQGYLTFLIRMWQYWIGHWPTYTKALWIAARSKNKKPTYVVTRKTRQNGFYGKLLWPQFLYLFIGSILVARGIFGLPEVTFETRAANVSALLFFMFMISRICRAAFYGMQILPRVSFPPLTQYFYRMAAWVISGTNNSVGDSLILTEPRLIERRSLSAPASAE